ncbi:MAG: RluA family pseudouridine synthase [Planctomycetota bacterium]|nr:MAG: RluA family pseudouridine synthase [Planctomycetota bacterium]
MQILYEDNHLLVVNKPPGIPTMGTQSGVPSVYYWAVNHLKRKYNKPGNVYVGIVSRLDKDVSGVLVLARTSKAAARLSAQIRDRSVTKRYVAEVLGRLTSEPTSDWHEWVDWLRKNERAQRMEVLPSASRDASRAELRIRQLATTRSGALVEVELVTGRKHQIRVQLAARGLAIRGDTKYGTASHRPRSQQGIRLHCYQVTIHHPTRRAPMTFTALPTELWADVPSTVWDEFGDGGSPVTSESPQ